MDPAIFQRFEAELDRKIEAVNGALGRISEAQLPPEVRGPVRELRASCRSLVELLADLRMVTSPAATAKAKQEVDLLLAVREVTDRYTHRLGMTIIARQRADAPRKVHGDPKTLERSLALMIEGLTFASKGRAVLDVEPIDGGKIRFTMSGHARSWCDETGAAIANELVTRAGGAIEPSGFVMQLGVPAVRGPVRVLLAEDNAFNQKIAMAMLAKCGVEAKAASNGQEALDLAASGAFDLVFMDCYMPELDGFEATAALRKQQIAIPIVAMSAAETDEDRERCKEVGMNDFLAKPVKKEILAAAIAKWAGVELRR